MNDSRYVPFSPGHLDFFEANDPWDTLPEDLAVVSNNPCWDLMTLIKGKEILGLAGICEHRKGIGEIWVIPDKNFKKHTYTFIKQSRDLIDWCFNDRGMTRVQATIKSGDNTALLWIDKLGFHLEGLMQKWSGGHDYFLYARLK